MDRSRFVRLARRDGGEQCFYCSCGLDTESATADHYWPRDAGGTNDERNLVLACRPCNKRKSNILPHVWRPEVDPPPGWPEQCIKGSKVKKAQRLMQPVFGEFEIVWDFALRKWVKQRRLDEPGEWAS